MILNSPAVDVYHEVNQELFKDASSEFCWKLIERKQKTDQFNKSILNLHSLL